MTKPAAPIDPLQAPELRHSHEFFLSAISLLHHHRKTTVVPELLQLLTPRQLMALSQVYGGTNLQLPTSEELSTALWASLYVYYIYFLNKSENAFLRLSECPEEKLVEVRKLALWWKSEYADKHITLMTSLAEQRHQFHG